MADSPERIQGEYYERTALLYDSMHTSNKSDEHYRALTFIDALSHSYGLRTFLDVGAGTGRGVRFFLDRGKEVRGLEPVQKLIEQGELQGIPKGLITRGDGYSIPYANDSVDAVFECGILHHVAHPDRVVNEMLRVARRAVFISDDNRFGHGTFPARVLKLLLCKTKLWRLARMIRTGGKMYLISEGDGLAYSYSVFDSLNQLASWGDHVWTLPTDENLAVRSWLHPLLTSPHALLCAIKDEPGAS